MPRPRCLDCIHRRWGPVRRPHPANFTIMVCSKRRLRFGLMVDVLSGQANGEAGTVACPDQCEEFRVDC